MHVFHPPQSVNGLPPENTFYVADSANMTVADGFLIPTYHPYLFPDRPINLFMSIRSKGPGRDMLMGALLARAQGADPSMARAAVCAGQPAGYADDGLLYGKWL